MDVRKFLGKSSKSRTVIKGRKKVSVSRIARSSALTKVIRKVAKRTFNQNTETKYCTMIAEDNVSHNSGIFASDQYRLMPQVKTTASSLSFGRVGDKIAPVSMYVRGMVGLTNPAPNNSAVMVRVLVLQQKGQHYWPSATQAWASGAYNVLLKKNDETGVEDVAYNGYQQDNFTPVNKDVFEVLGERFIKLEGQKDGSVESASINALAKNFNIKIRTPKKLTYGQGLSIYPENFAPFVCIGYSYMDGTAPDTITTPLVANVFSHLYYKDA